MPFTEALLVTIVILFVVIMYSIIMFSDLFEQNKIHRRNRRILKKGSGEKLVPKQLANVNVGDKLYSVPLRSIRSFFRTFTFKKVNEDIISTVIIEEMHIYEVTSVLPTEICIKDTDESNGCISLSFKKIGDSYVSEAHEQLFATSFELLKAYLKKMENDMKQDILGKMAKNEDSRDPDKVIEWLNKLEKTTLKA